MRITPTALTRLAGVAAVTAGLLFIRVQVNHPPLDAATIATTEMAIRSPLKGLMAALALVGITGMYLRQVRETGVLGLVGYLLFAAGYLLILGTQFASAFVLPAIADTNPGYVNDVIAVALAGTPDGDIGPLATEQILDTVDRRVRESVAAGARLLTGGKRLERIDLAGVRDGVDRAQDAVGLRDARAVVGLDAREIELHERGGRELAGPFLHAPLERLAAFPGRALGLLIAAIRRATRLALAMDARGFASLPCRTLARPRSFAARDLALVAGSLAVVAIATAASMSLGTWRPLIAF